MQDLFSHFPGLLRVSAQASILIVLVLAAQWCCGRRLPPRWRSALWLLVLLRLALPWTVPSPSSVFNVVKLPVPATPTPPAAGVGEMAEVPAAAAAEETAVSFIPEPASGGGYWAALGCVWAAGAFGLTGCAALNHYRIHRRVAGRRPVTHEPTLNLLEECKELMGVSVPVTLIETEAVQSPALFGFVRPRLLLPAGLANRFTPAELRHVFLHELAHLKRHDVLAGWAILGLQTIHWFNPLVWLAFHRLRADRELACDALALSHAQPGENQAYGLTVVKLLEEFGRSVWAPSLAGILENKQQMKERISMIAKFRDNNRGRALAFALFGGLALVALTDARTGSLAAASGNGQASTARKGTKAGEPGWSLQEKLDLAKAGNQWAVYDLWDAYYRGNHGVQPDQSEATKWLGKLVEDLYVVKFEPVDDFSPASPGEFLQQINKHSPSRSGRTKIGAASFFRTTAQGDKLIGSFLSDSPDELKANLAKVPGLKVISAERITPEAFVKYERSQQESIWSLQQKIKASESGNDWATYDLWDAYSRGKHGVQTDSTEAQKWLNKLVKELWVVRFEPVEGFAPTNPGEFLGRINQHSSCRSGQTRIGAASFFRTTKQGDKLVGSFLSNFPDQLKASLAKVPGLKVTGSERVTPEAFVQYEKSPQESL